MKPTEYTVFAAAEDACDPGDLVVNVVLRVAVEADALQPAVTISPAASNGAAPARPPVTVVGSAGHRETTLM
jgi:hypothetical protein